MPSADESLDYLLTVLKHTELPQPDYHAVATETGASNANTAQKRFKAVIESQGFLLVNKQIVSADGASKGGAVQAAKNAGAKKKGVAVPKRKNPPKAVASKKRQRAESEDSGNASASGDANAGTGARKATTKAVSHKKRKRAESEHSGSASASANGDASADTGPGPEDPDDDGEQVVKAEEDEDAGMTEPEEEGDGEAMHGANGRARSETVEESIKIDDEE